MAKTTYVSEINGVKLYAERAQYTREGKDIDSKFNEIEQEIVSMGSFEVVPLTSGAKPVPDVKNPSTKIIYLTKDSSSSAKDPYTEWIYIAANPETDPPVSAHWEVIGETSIDLSGYKTKQSTVSVTGGTLKGVASMTQNENGEVTLTLNDIQDGTTSQKGVVQLEDSHSSTSTTTAATPKSVKEAYDLANGKQDPITFEGTYNASTNKAATESTVSDAIEALDAEETSVDGTNVQVKVTQVDGVVTAVNITTDNTLSAADVADKADKVDDAVSGHFAGLDENGNLTDSGKQASDFKTKQDAVHDPTADGSGLSFIDAASQDANGVVTLHKKTVPDGTTAQKGVVQLAGSIGATVSTENNKAASEKAVRDAINALDATVASAGDTGVTPNFGISVTEADGVITGVTITADSTETTDNKVTAWSSTTTDAHYPSEKLVKGSLDGKADKVASATNGNFAGLDTNGNLTDSGKKAADFAAAAHAHGNITTDGKIGSTADLAVVTTTDGAVTTANLTTSAPSASGTSVEFIDSVSQDSKGKITATKKTVASVVASSSGQGGSAGLMPADAMEKLNGIAAGAQVNAIETIQSNGTALSITNKTVNIPAASTGGVYGVVTYTTIDLD